MKRLSHKQLHRLLIWVFIISLLLGMGLMMIISVQTAAQQAQNNPFPIARDRTN